MKPFRHHVVIVILQIVLCSHQMEKKILNYKFWLIFTEPHQPMQNKSLNFHIINFFLSFNLADKLNYSTFAIHDLF